MPGSRLALLAALTLALVAVQAGAAATTARVGGGPTAKHRVAKNAMQRQQQRKARAVQRQLRRVLAARLRKRPPAPPTGQSSPPSAPATAVPAPSSYRDRVGVASHTIWYEPAKQLEHLKRMRANGITWAREDFHWGAFEQSKGSWNWQLGDTFMRNASIAGVNVLATIAYSAEWAASGPSEYNPPRDPAEYANFCRRLIERYGPNGTFWRDNPGLEARPLRAVEIWNEPWLAYFWRPSPDPAAYARLVRAAATAIRAADPTVKILASADLYGSDEADRPVTWFSALLDADPALFRDLVDAYSVHCYSQERSPMDSTTRQLWRFDRFLATRDLAAAAGASHPVWITEFGWTTYQGDPDGVSEQTQALYLGQALRRVVEEFPGVVERSFVFQWGNPSPDRTGGHSLLREDGSAKPALQTLKSLLT